jgi:small subunit ribosomal protein S5
MELAGVRDVLTKALGSTTPVNLVKATVEGLKSLRTKAQIEQTRGVKITQ